MIVFSFRTSQDHCLQLNAMHTVVTFQAYFSSVILIITTNDMFDTIVRRCLLLYHHKLDLKWKSMGAEALPGQSAQGYVLCGMLPAKFLPNLQLQKHLQCPPSHSELNGSK